MTEHHSNDDFLIIDDPYPGQKPSVKRLADLNAQYLWRKYGGVTINHDRLDFRSLVAREEAMSALAEVEMFSAALERVAIAMNQSLPRMTDAFGAAAKAVGSFSKTIPEEVLAALQKMERDRQWRDDPLRLKERFIDPAIEHFREMLSP